MSTLIVSITEQRADKLKQSTNAPTIAVRMKVAGKKRDIMAVMANPFYVEAPQEDAKKMGRAIKRTTKALGEMMAQVGAAANQPALEELGEHTKQESKRLNKKKNDSQYSVMKSALKQS